MASRVAARSTARYRPGNARLKASAIAATVQISTGPGSISVSAVAAEAAKPEITEMATTACGTKIAHTAHRRGPGTRAGPRRGCRPVQTV